MSVKVRELYYQIKDSKNEIELVAGVGGLSNLVDWFHVVEVKEIAEFLEGKEIVIITGIGLKEKGESLFDIIKACIYHNASAIIVNIGPYILSVEQEIIDFCNDNSFPLFVSPWNVYMANLYRIIAHVLNGNNEKTLQLVTAFRNAICFPNEQELYIPDLKRYDYQVEWKYCIAVIKMIDRKSKKILERDIQRKLRKKIRNSIAFLASEAMVFRLHDDIIICFANKSENSIKQILNMVVDNLGRKVLEEYIGYIGIGRNTKSIKCINKTYVIAQKVAKLQIKMNKEYEVLSYKDLGISKLFLAMEDLEIMNEYYGDILKPLVDYDEMNHSDFVEFLEIYFEEECIIQNIAERLFLHRNSINYKIKKIEDILGCNINDFHVKAELLIALKLRMLL